MASFLPQLRAQSGSLDPTFDPGTGVDNQVYSIAMQTNGQIVIGGTFSIFNGMSRTNVARLNSNGSLDTNFVSSSVIGGSYPYINAVALQAGGKVLLGGSFTTGVTTNLARLNTSGTLDATFAAGTDANGTVSALAVQTNGSVVVGGSFAQLNGAPRASIARLSADGVLEGGFNPSLAGGLSEVLALAVQSDGRVVFAGSFTSVSASMQTNIARLNADGTLDRGFKPVSVGGGSLFPAVPGIFYALAVDAQGRVIAGGDFTFVNSQVRTNLVRFNSDGSLDSTFNPAAGTDSAVNSVVVQNDGKVLLGGEFTLVNGAPRNYVARLNADGTLDDTFDIGTGANDVVYALALQPDGKVLIGGGFSSFNGTPRNGIARLLPPLLLLNPVWSNSTFRVSVATVSGRSYSLQYKNSITDNTWTVLPSVPGDGSTQTLIDSLATPARRFYRVEVQ